MFKRIAYDDWTSVVPVIAFILTFLVFLYFLVRAISMKRSHAERMGKLPLEDDPPNDQPKP